MKSFFFSQLKLSSQIFNYYLHLQTHISAFIANCVEFTTDLVQIRISNACINIEKFIQR